MQNQTIRQPNLSKIFFFLQVERFRRRETGDTSWPSPAYTSSLREYAMHTGFKPEQIESSIDFMYDLQEAKANQLLKNSLTS